MPMRRTGKAGGGVEVARDEVAHAHQAQGGIAARRRHVDPEQLGQLARRFVGLGGAHKQIPPIAGTKRRCECQTI